MANLFPKISFVILNISGSEKDKIKVGNITAGS
jgi:hypothetical protein